MPRLLTRPLFPFLAPVLPDLPLLLVQLQLQVRVRRNFFFFFLLDACLTFFFPAAAVPQNLPLLVKKDIAAQEEKFKNHLAKIQALLVHFCFFFLFFVFLLNFCVGSSCGGADGA